MSDETKPEPAETAPAKTYTQEEIDRIIGQRIGREKEKYADYDSIKQEAETLKVKIKEREEAELSELEKSKQRQEELEKEVEKHKVNTDWRDKWTVDETAKIEKEMEDLTEDQKELIVSLPLDKRTSAIGQFKASTPGSPDGSKGGPSFKTEITQQRLIEHRMKHGENEEYKSMKKQWVEQQRS